MLTLITIAIHEYSFVEIDVNIEYTCQHIVHNMLVYANLALLGWITAGDWENVC